MLRFPGQRLLHREGIHRCGVLRHRDVSGPLSNPVGLRHRFVRVVTRR
ncbi:hypothetical protein R0J91_02930 [Micrococcus sp. SIMBA_131]